MREKVNRLNEVKNSQFTHAIPKRSKSVDRSKSGVFMQYKILEDPETQRLGYYAYEHPQRSYKRFIKRHARTNFAELRVLSAGDPKTFKNLVRRERPNVHIRVHSQHHRQSKRHEEFKPMTKEDLKIIS
jgi:hypothetical protein